MLYQSWHRQISRWQPLVHSDHLELCFWSLFWQKKIFMYHGNLKNQYLISARCQYFPAILWLARKLKKKRNLTAVTEWSLPNQWQFSNCNFHFNSNCIAGLLLWSIRAGNGWVTGEPSGCGAVCTRQWFRRQWQMVRWFDAATDSTPTCQRISDCPPVTWASPYATNWHRVTEMTSNREKQEIIKCDDRLII